MPLVVLGISHKTAPAHVRDRHAFPRERIVEALGALRDYSAVREAAIVSTCNRLEVYAEVSDFEVGVGQLKDFLTTYRSMRVEDFEKYLYTLLGAQAVDQLFRVAGGLDSMLVGEHEIIRQVRESLDDAKRARSAGPALNRLFRTALQVGKRARTQTRIGRDLTSLGAAAVELAARHCTLPSSRTLVVGAGKMATTIAKRLHSRGARSIAISNRTTERAARLARAVGATALGLDELSAMMVEVDAVFVSVAAQRPLLSREAIAAAARRRTGSGPLLVVDISVPSAVESCDGLAGVAAYRLDDLKEIVDASLESRRAEIPVVEEIVHDGVREFMRWYQSRAAGPIIATLRERADSIREAEVRKLFARLPDLTERQRAGIAATSVSIINRLLHAPVTKLRERAAEPGAELAEHAILDLAELSQQIERQLTEQLDPASCPDPASAKRH